MEPIAATRVPVDEELLSHYLPGASYADAFTAQTAGTPSARDWARLTLAGGSKVVREAFGKAVWGGALGFKLAPADTPDTFVGWHIEVDEPDLFVVATDGRLMEGRMIFAVTKSSDITESTVTWTTAIKYHSSAAKAIWAVAQNAHRQIARRILGRAASALRRRATV